MNTQTETSEVTANSETSTPAFNPICDQLAKINEPFGTYKAYDSKIELTEITGTRVVKCLYQMNAKTGKKHRESEYVRIPTAHITEQVVIEGIERLAPYLVGYLQSVEDKMINADHRKGALSVYTDGLTLDKIVEHIESTEAGSRLNKEMLTLWFTDHVANKLGDLFAAKLGFDPETISDDEMQKLIKIVQAYQVKFEALASPKVSVKPEDCAAMIKVIDQCEVAGTSIGSKLKIKLDTLSKIQVEDLAAL